MGVDPTAAARLILGSDQTAILQKRRMCEPSPGVEPKLNSLKFGDHENGPSNPPSNRVVESTEAAKPPELALVLQLRFATALEHPLIELVYGLISQAVSPLPRSGLPPFLGTATRRYASAAGASREDGFSALLQLTDAHKLLRCAGQFLSTPKLWNCH